MHLPKAGRGLFPALPATAHWMAPGTVAEIIILASKEPSGRQDRGVPCFCPQDSGVVSSPLPEDFSGQGCLGGFIWNNGWHTSWFPSVNS